MSVVVGVVLAGFCGVVGGVVLMTLRDVRVVAGRLMAARFMVLGGGEMVLGRAFVMRRGFAVMVCSFLGHGFLLDVGSPSWANFRSRLAPGYDARVKPLQRYLIPIRMSTFNPKAKMPAPSSTQTGSVSTQASRRLRSVSICSPE